MSSIDRYSPIKAPPLRFPGQSVQAAMEQLLWEGVFPYFIASLWLVLMAAIEWLAAMRRLPRQPGIYTALAVLAVGVFVFRWRRAKVRLERLRLGRDGEQAVGQFLDGLRVHGARVFHDVPGRGFNLDHVVLSTHGFYIVETKTRRKASGVDARVTLTEDGLLVSGCAPERNPVDQANAAARWLKGFLEESTGKRFPVRGVVVFPGWWVQPMSDEWKRSPEKPWVLEPKALPEFIEREPVNVAESDVALAAYHLSRYVRSAAT